MISITSEEFEIYYVLLGIVQDGVFTLKKRHKDDNTHNALFSKYNTSEIAQYFINDSSPDYYCKIVPVKQYKIHEASISLVLNELVVNNFTGGFPYSKCYTGFFHINSSATGYIDSSNEKYILIVTDTLNTDLSSCTKKFSTVLPPIISQTRFSLSLACFQLVHNLYISNKYAGFVHGDLYHGTNYNTAYTTREVQNITHVTYRVINSATKESTYYVFKLNTIGMIPLLTYMDFGLSDIHIPNNGLAGENYSSRLPNVNPSVAKYRSARSKNEVKLTQGSQEYRNIKRNFDIFALDKIMNVILTTYDNTNFKMFSTKLLAPFAFNQDIVEISGDWLGYGWYDNYGGLSYNTSDNILLNEQLMDKNIWEELLKMDIDDNAHVFTKKEYDDFVKKNDTFKFYLFGELNKEQYSSYRESLDRIKHKIDVISDYIKNPTSRNEPGITEIETHYKNGKLKEIGFVDQDGQKTGHWVGMRLNGHKEYEGDYVNHLKVGKWTEFGTNGNISTEMEYVNGDLNGKFIKWFDDGKKDSEGMWKNNKKTGLWTSWSSTGVKIYEGVYIDDKQFGIWTRWNSDGTIKEKQHFDKRGDELDPFESRWPNGNIQSQGFYDINGKRAGRWIDYDENGIKQSEGEFLNGYKNGLWIAYYLSGTVTHKTYFINDASLHNPTDATIHVTKHLNGMDESLTFIDKDGKKTGQFFKWYDDGSTSINGDYLDDKKTGQWTYYHLNGHIKANGEYLDDKRINKWSYWYDNGKIHMIGQYENGKVVGKMTTYDKNGKKTS